jgi:ABC-type sugar transport system permease subunit
VAIIFMILLQQRQGLLPHALGAIKTSWAEIDFLQNPVLARLSVVLASLWLSVGWGMIFFLAALQSVSHELYDAAQVDGAGRWARFWHITLPGIRPVLVFLILVGTIGGFQLFELPFVLFGGPGPGWAGLTIVMYLYQNGFEMGDLGGASAIGWLLVCFILVVSLLQIKFSGAAREEPA